MIKIAVDCMGGDTGLRVTVPAAVRIVSQYSDVHFLLVGDEKRIKKELKKAHKGDRSRFEIVHASEVVSGDDTVEVALRRKKDSSMRVAIDCVKDGRADACVSAGNTGALMAISRFVLKMLEGIDRPAIATMLPNMKGGGTTVLDLGANIECSAHNLLDFAIMGSALAQVVDHIEAPTVGLLNVGAEAMKGSDVVKQAAELIKQSNLNFIGNVEGNNIFEGTTDVVVCDGFVGNSVLKSIEGVVAMVGRTMKSEFKRNAYTRLVALLVSPVLKKFRNRIDNRRYNGASLLGLRGVVIKSHGSADRLAFTCAIERAREAIAHDLLTKISDNVEHMKSIIVEPAQDELQQAYKAAL